ncbi:MAG: ABC transporter permease [Theionarchaea archaeon]|nr:ABC transporter permease [Theionarchaea archaeon]MBU7000365.1 ABC transporter permease [Theionarchaea archaeon]MBU7021207.1 ABC transporter permease [Theionarchaea archaeon]MBU7036080.1 ABC transporter permease [Theionarchaea archaeon]MBU7041772.1 ABC transporter permease [Theionarchaea archaeon]
MSKFTAIMVKEMKDLLRDPKVVVGMIVVPLVLFPAMGAMFRTGMESAESEIQIGVMNQDTGQVSQDLIQILENNPGVKLYQPQSSSLEEAIQEAQTNEVKVLLVIPSGFSDKIEHTTGAEIDMYALVEGLGINEVISSSRVDAIIQGVNTQLSKNLISEKVPGTDPGNVLQPITTRGYTVVRGKTVNVPPALIASLVSSQSFIVPVVLMVMIMFVAQMAATSMATEKENKTLETLLTLPVSRLSILAGKMGGTAVVSLISAVAYIIGFSYYMSAFQFGEVESAITLKDIGLSITPVGFVMLGISIFMAVLAALSLSMVLAVFTQDVRSAQSLVSFTIMPLVFPSMIFIFADMNSLPVALKYVLLALPFSHPTIAASALALKNYSIVIGGIVYLGIFTLVVLLIAARMFNTERVVTAKITFGRKKSKSQP